LACIHREEAQLMAGVQQVMPRYLQQAIDLIATAAALGLPVPAPAGTTAYTWHAPRLEQDPDARRRGQAAVLTPGIHASYDTALTGLADAAIAFHDTTRRVAAAPWACPDFFDAVTGEQWRSDMPGWLAAHRTAQDQARDVWLTGRTPLDIVLELLGSSGRDWTVHPVTILL
jgi:hypothetical protein